MNLRVLAAGLPVVLVVACTSFGSAVPEGADAAATDGAPVVPAEGGAAVDGEAPDPFDAGRVRDAGGDGPSPPVRWGAIFVTTTTLKGAMGDSQAAADAICNQEAQVLRPGTTSFVAVLSVAQGDGLAARLKGSTGPRYVPGPGGVRGPRAIVNVDVAASPLGPVGAHANGAPIPVSAFVWTGGFGPQPTERRRCVGDPGTAWSTNSVGFVGTVGDPSQTGPGAGYVAEMTCDAPQRLYCAELGDFF